ncbi:MAG: Spy/CpxP family protein refolding chaperone [Planctomycetota bacterium]|nr:Spy/CpxP family protein refolding chaperone [Planctomycetota bacterium]
MKRFALLLCGLAALLLTCAPAMARKCAEGEKDSKPKAALCGEYALMVKKLDLTDKQQADLKKLVRTKKAALAAWDKENGKRCKELHKACKAGDPKAQKDAKKQLRTLAAERKKIEKRHAARIQRILTPEQKTRWKGFQLYRSVTARLCKVKLTDAQKADIEQRALLVSKKTAQLPSADKKGRKQARARLYKDVVKEVLTEQQRQEIRERQLEKKRKKAAREHIEKKQECKDDAKAGNN